MDETLPDAPGATLGPGKLDMLHSELLTDEVEDEYDALNDETFGGSLQVPDDWECDHEKLIQLDEEHRFHNESNGTVKHDVDVSFNTDIRKDSYNDSAFEGSLMQSSYMDTFFANPEDAIEKSLTKLVLDDELDDPAIMNISRSKPVAIPHPAISRRSPPPPAILESDNVGSPSTNSIWTPPHKLDSMPGDSSFSLLYSSLQKMLVNFQMLNDPSIVGIGRDIQKNVLPSEIIQKAKTVDEIERDLLNMNDQPINARKEEIEHGITQSQCGAFSDEQQHIVQNSPLQCMESQFAINQESNLPSARNSLFDVSQLGSSAAKNSHASDVGNCGSSSLYNIRPSESSPYKMPKMNFKSYVGQPYMNRLIPPQVGFTRPLIMQPRAFLGGPLHLPTVIPPVNRPSVPGLVPFSQSRLCFAPQPMYFENRFQKLLPPHLYAQQNLMQAQAVQRANSRLANHMMSNTSEEDEYDNLMTQKEKEWLIKIQMIQLQTNNPYLDDYYYTMYTIKKKIEEQNKGGGDRGQEPKLVVPETSKVETRTYKPAQYEGSLGKLQAVSVNFPRKIIDLETMHPEDADNEQSCNKDLRKFRQVSLEIEKLYSLFLTIDDLDKKMAALPKESCQQLEDIKRNTILSIYNTLSTAIASEEKFVQLMVIRKGRNFVCRVLPLFALEEKFHLITAIVDNWNVIMKKLNDDEALHCFGVHFMDAVFNAVCMKKLMQLGRALRNNATDMALRMETLGNRNSNLIPALLHKLGIRITCALLSKAEALRQLDKETEDKDSELESEWKAFVGYVAELWSSSSDVSLVESSHPLVSKHFEYHMNDEKKLEFLKKKLQAVSLHDGTGDNSA